MSAVLSAIVLAGLSVGQHCDIPGLAAANLKVPSAENCAEACQKGDNCRAWVYVSGWGRCSLKQKVLKPVALRIHSGAVEVDDAGARKLGPVNEDSDNSGKDLRRVSGLADAAACSVKCLEGGDCKAWSFLDGYGDCWLKKTAGKTIPKEFYCGAVGAEVADNGGPLVAANGLLPAGAAPKPPKPVGNGRIIKHTDAYSAHPERGQHVDLKITPPEKRGKDTMILVEIYNRSKAHISVLTFDIVFRNHGAQDISTSITAEDMVPGWSISRWIKIPGSGKIPAIDGVDVSNIKMFDKEAKDLNFKVYADLIKE